MQSICYHFTKYHFIDTGFSIYLYFLTFVYVSSEHDLSTNQQLEQFKLRECIYIFLNWYFIFKSLQRNLHATLPHSQTPSLSLSLSISLALPSSLSDSLSLPLSLSVSVQVSCPVCHKLYFRAYIKVHMQTHSEERPVRARTFVCEECGRGLVTAQALRNHMRIHTGENPFRCDECSKTFTQAKGLHSHMLTHTGVKGFVCQVRFPWVFFVSLY